MSPFFMNNLHFYNKHSILQKWDVKMNKIFKYFILLLMFISVSCFSKTILIGDSLMGGIGYCYNQKHDSYVFYKESSGLINDSFFDWNDAIVRLKLENYDKIVISLGTNDILPIRNREVGNPDWKILYKTKIALFIENILNSNENIEILWILPPNLRNTDKNRKIDIVKSVIRANYIFGYRVIDPSDKIGYNYTKFIGKNKIRTDDGIHYTKYTSCLISDMIEGGF